MARRLLIFVATNMSGNVLRSCQKHPKHAPLKTPSVVTNNMAGLSEASHMTTGDLSSEISSLLP